MLTRFGGEAEILDTSKNASDAFGHGGGDFGIVKDLIDIFDPDVPASPSLTSIDVSIESHIVALAAEKSRINGGMLVDISKFTNI